MDNITHDQALELFKLPRKLGVTEAGEEIVANVGRFGPYLKYGAKYVSLKTDDPYEIAPDRALEVIREKEIADKNRLIQDFPEDKIQVLNGRFGPYITDKERNAKIPKDRDPKTLTVEECRSMLAAAPVRTFGKWGRGKKGANTKARTGAAKASSAPAAPAAAGSDSKAAAPAGKKPPRKVSTPAGKSAPPPPPAATRRLAAKASKPAADKKAAVPPSKLKKKNPAKKKT